MTTGTNSPLPNKEKEAILSKYYTEGHFNSPQRVGYVMKMIRTRNPLIEEEWRSWYTDKIHDEAYLEKLAGEMFRTIPSSDGISYRDCLRYIHDVMFRRTFLSYNKTKRGLQILRDVLSPTFEEAPSDWQKTYAIHYYAKSHAGKYVCVHLSYHPAREAGIEKADVVEKKLDLFRSQNDGSAFSLLYTADNTGTVEFLFPDMLDDIRAAIEEKADPLPDKLDVDFNRLGEYLERSCDNGSHVSYPFILQRRTGQKDLVWFLYSIVGPDDDNLYACVTDLFLLAPDGTLTRKAVTLEAAYSGEAQPDLDFDRYVKALEKLYRSFSVNKMNSLLWEKAQKPLYSTYQAVKSEFLKEPDRRG